MMIRITSESNRAVDLLPRPLPREAYTSDMAAIAEAQTASERTFDQQLLDHIRVTILRDAPRFWDSICIAPFWERKSA